MTSNGKVSDAFTIAMTLIAHNRHVQIRDPKCAEPVAIIAYTQPDRIIRLLSNPTTILIAEPAPADWKPKPDVNTDVGPVAGGDTSEDWPINRVLAALRSQDRAVKGPKNAGQYGRIWRSKCPYHRGQSPWSLSIGEKGNGAAWVKCWDRCPTRDILGALGLQSWDLYQKGDHRLGDDPRAERLKVPAPSAPVAVARAFLKARYGDSPPTLCCWRGSFYSWRGSAWSEIDHDAIRGDLYAWLEDAVYEEWDPKAKESIEVAWKPSRQKIINALEALQAVAHLPTEVEDRSWVHYDRRWLPDTRRHAWFTTAAPITDVIPVADGLFHSPTRELHPPSAGFFNLSAIPLSLREYCVQWENTRVYACPAWLKFLESLWPNDSESVCLLQEWFGYILSGDTHQQKMLLLIGPPRSGKGTIARVLTALAGVANTAAPTMASLVGTFGLAPLIGKTLAVVSDARFGGRDIATVVERLLAISGEDPQTVDRKHKAHWTGRLGVRFMLLSNELPRLGDVSGAIATRFVILELAKSWLGGEDLGLEGRLTEELPGILLWALDGLDRLRRHGRFGEPEASKDAERVLMDFTSPTRAFVRECCEVGAFEVPTTEAFDAWRAWCQGAGREHPGTEQTFGRDMRAAVPGMRTRQRVVEHLDVRVYCGFKLNGGPRTVGAPEGIPEGAAVLRRQAPGEWQLIAPTGQGWRCCWGLWAGRDQAEAHATSHGWQAVVMPDNPRTEE